MDTTGRIASGMVAFVILMMIYGRFAGDSFLIGLGLNLQDSGVMFFTRTIRFLALAAIFGFSTGYMFLDVKMMAFNSVAGMAAYYIMRNIGAISSNGFSVWEDFFMSLIIVAIFMISMRIFSSEFEYGYV